MTTVDEEREPLFEQRPARGEILGEFCTLTVDGLPKGRDLFWRVTITRGQPGHLERSVCQRATPDEPWQEFAVASTDDPRSWRPEPIIWPMWAPGLLDIKISETTPLTNIHDYWSTTGERLRDSAKWMATVLGLALGALVGTSPLAEMHKNPPRTLAIITGVAGLALLGVTLFLLLQVMRPQSVSFDEVQRSGSFRANLFRPLHKWKVTVESQQDLYLPCGVKCLTSLRQAMIIEELSLFALANAVSTCTPEDNEILEKAQKGRAARLKELRDAACQVAVIGEFYRLRFRSSWATYAGLPCGLIGTALVMGAFIWR
ncbi:hypothetical protein J4573_26795 [Actinomadura barringtoniae]|uniref:Uncharacterized protein n=1 Tax=Actinomadura barringtoniae TaxID=1427535 RepID=A0A939T381_9ACTN|nr:hypothetical protein [Actinomadura barringtoniae]MBO2450741.1 hypothetical protein [Actinomadura barringtoniae]